jgi:hypothetical protein
MKALTIALITITMMSCGGSKSADGGKIASGKMDGEWIDMLANINDWHVYNKPGTVGSAWSLKDGVLHLSAANKNNGKIVDGGDLVYKDEFENFHLKLEWRISPGGNSGIIFYVKEDPKYKHPYTTGPEMQVLDNTAHPDAKIIKHRAGDLYDLIACKKEVVKPVGEWNLAEIVSKNGKLDFYLNGEHVVSTTMWNDAWNTMVAGSKFRDWADFAKFKSGKICLQDHDDEVWYRKAMIKKL